MYLPQCILNITIVPASAACSSSSLNMCTILCVQKLPTFKSFPSTLNPSTGSGLPYRSGKAMTILYIIVSRYFVYPYKLIP